MSSVAQSISSSSSSQASADASNDDTTLMSAAGRRRWGHADGVVLVLTENDDLTHAARRLFPQLLEQGCIVVRVLPVGDAAVEHGARTLVVVERKTLRDLAASRVDGRWRAQRERMQRLGAHVVYVIQAEWEDLYSEWVRPDDTTYGSVSNGVLHGMLRNAVCFDGHSVVFTGRSIDSMARWLVNYVWHTWAQVPAVKPPRRPSSDMEHALAAVARPASSLSSGLSAGGGGTALKKSDNMSPAVFLVAALSMVPGLGEARAQTVAAEYGALPALLDALRDGDGRAGIRALTDLPGIGNVLAEQIYQYLLNRAPPPKAPPKRRRAAAAAPKAAAADASMAASGATAAAAAAVTGDDAAGDDKLPPKRRRAAAPKKKATAPKGTSAAIVVIPDDDDDDDDAVVSSAAAPQGAISESDAASEAPNGGAAKESADTEAPREDRRRDNDDASDVATTSSSSSLSSEMS